MKQPCVYILANKPGGNTYIGVTGYALKRTYQHRERLVEGYAKKYWINRLVYFELHETMTDAITREKQLKKWNQAWKFRLIEENNPTWRDLWPDIVG